MNFTNISLVKRISLCYAPTADVSIGSTKLIEVNKSAAVAELVDAQR